MHTQLRGVHTSAICQLAPDMCPAPVTPACCPRRAQLGAGDAEAYLASQGQALTLLRSLAGRVHGDLGAGISLKSRAATICCDMAEQCQKQRKFDKVLP